MSLKYACAIAGVAESRLGVVPDSTVMTLQAEAMVKALAEAGLEKKDVDAVFSSGNWGRLPQLQVAEYLGINPVYSDNTSVGGASFEFHLGHAAAAIQAGLCKVAIILYGSTQRSRRERRIFEAHSDLGYQYETPYGLPIPVGAYALAASRHMAQYGTTSQQLAELAVSTRAWASLNPSAYRREKLTVDEVLDSQMIASPLHRLDCCLVTDGGGCVVVVSPELAKSLPKPPVWLLGQGESHSHAQISEMPDLTITPAAESGKRAFAMAGIKHSDLDVVEIYDSFTITVILTLESLGFCAPGEGGEFVSSNRTAPGGEFPLNTNGGGLSYCHPGQYGIFLLIESVRQLRGECGDRQVNNATLALASGTGGVLSSNSTCILGLE
ncbi:MAG: thiolase [Rhodospirillaceae bacterium]|nr:thiolase [Rhodospirillaceae bacterium]|tara:strand:- start:229 stop:1374 length:1146 start_codon:yes stop_codon:yes gene_type:complete